jgi:hypothetical protein
LEIFSSDNNGARDVTALLQCKILVAARLLRSAVGGPAYHRLDRSTRPVGRVSANIAVDSPLAPSAN